MSGIIWAAVFESRLFQPEYPGSDPITSIYASDAEFSFCFSSADLLL